MNWFIAKIVFAISVSDTQHKPQFDEQLRLIAADTAAEAFTKAKTIGICEEDSFLNAASNMVKWEFINVSEVIKLATIEDGASLYSSILESEEATAYINSVHQKAIYLRSTFSPTI